MNQLVAWQKSAAANRLNFKILTFWKVFNGRPFNVCEKILFTNYNSKFQFKLVVNYIEF